METYQPRVVRGRTELCVPHNGNEIAFASPSHGPGTYQDVGSKILKSGQKVPTGDYTASLLHSAYCSAIKEEPELANVRQIMRNNWLWVYNRALWTEKGVYIIPDENVVGRSEQLSINDLEKMLNGGKELSWGGIRFSSDGKVRFAPKGSYQLGKHTSESLVKDGFIIANCNEEGALKIGKVSIAFKNLPFTYGLEIQNGQAPELRVSAVSEVDDRLRFNGDKIIYPSAEPPAPVDDRLRFYGNYFGDYYDCHAFGVWACFLDK